MAAKKAKRKTKKTVAKTEVAVEAKAEAPIEKVIKKTGSRESVKLSREQLETMAGGGATLNLTVHGKKPELKYFWSDDTHLQEFLIKGYTHVQSDEIQGVGGASIGAGFRNGANGIGDNVVVSKRGVTLYLMACHRDTYNQIQAYKQGEILQGEEAIYNRDGDGIQALDIKGNNFR